MITTLRKDLANSGEVEDTVVLGRQFLRHVYTVLDYQTNQVMLGPRSYSVEHGMLDCVRAVSENQLVVTILVCFLACTIVLICGMLLFVRRGASSRHRNDSIKSLVSGHLIRSSLNGNNSVVFHGSNRERVTSYSMCEDEKMTV